ncbi:tryptophan synthase subunit alpha [Lacrimispora saccharolytica]|uniref:Tryptophan synthase alpha chain n=1 Tax=Lacrimispora saccharolytica (strain ATCC 35040 / DSM 2544 / NRCC 2533 / WM1) TaxID=610130 RepID=D9RAV2_LACSW|nr:tryptophan synthase subunit alpha [Lacrimispora saccharolytica]ADL06149.1 tryptophan synthase, alpha subunit [[Clostridium] saccharolyticum WM1]QRV19739.1 tryptophan synthase subunit alpha [Lacrimispora saccharolytica]
MSRVSEVFSKGKAFIPFITAGDPDLSITEELVPAMAQAGADLIELGIPFSDPIAEGIVIQEADMRALASGVTTDKLFDSVKRIRQKTDVPLAFMTYINPVFVYGSERFIKNAAESGIDALIVPDMPFEEREELLPFCRKYGVELISLIAPTSKERIQAIASASEGFIYCVSSMGVTGVRTEINTDIREMVALVKETKDIPCAIGFGISTPDQAREMSKYADGVIVGSAIVKIAAKYGKDCVVPVCDYVREMKAAITG